MRRHESMYATPAQEVYIARLRNECFAKRVRTEWPAPDRSRRFLKSEASREIAMLKAALEQHTKGDAQ